MSILARMKGKGESGFGFASTAEDVTQGLELSDRTVLVTGSNSGLGFETTRVLALRGARVLAAARTLAKAKEVADKIPGNIVPVACELSDPRSVRTCVDTIMARNETLDMIICNAGIMALPKLERAFGYELQFFTNHIGHFILVTGLLDRVAEEGRIVILSSGAHSAAPKRGIEFDNLTGERGYQPWRAYGQSKLANLLFAKQLAKRLAGTHRTANAIHPGVIMTNLSRSMVPPMRWVLSAAQPLFMKSIPQGAATQVYVATHPQLVGVSGAYFADCNIARPTAAGENSELAERLWEVSERIVAETLQ